MKDCSQVGFLSCFFFYIQCCKGLNQNLLLHQCYKLHIFNVGVEPSIFNWLSVSTSLPRKPPKDRSSSTHTSTSPSGAVEKAVMSCMEMDADVKSTCPCGAEEVAVMSKCIEKEADSTQCQLSVSTPLPQKPPTDGRYTTHTSTSASGADEKAVVSGIEDADFTSTCPSGSEEMAVSTCIEKDGYFESKEAEV